MGSFSKYSSLDHAAPEVAHDNDAPEVDPGTSPQALDRRSSLLQPEPIQVAPYYKQEYGTHSSDGGSTAQIYSHSSEPGYVGLEVNENLDASQDFGEKQDGRRYCGMRKAVFILVLAGIVLLVCVGVILGAVLGTTLTKDNSNEKRLEAISMTGMATAVSGNKLYHYFQNPDGKLLENPYVDGAWTLKDSSDTDNALVTGEAGAGSPLAAISYPYQDESYRQLFYITSTGYVKTINRTEKRSWGSSTVISPDTASSGSIALAACWSNKLLDGIRVYYASQNGYIQEVGGSFDGSDWELRHGFTGSDVNAGVACSTHNYAQNQYLNVYVRNPVSKVVDQWYHDFEGGSPGFFSGASSWKNRSIAEGSDIAVCTDEQTTEYVFYQVNGGLITRGVTNPKKNSYQTFSNVQSASNGSKLSASYIQDGAMIMFQNKSSDSTMWASDASRDGVSIFNMAVA